MTNRMLFLGLGSPHGDDQAGWLVINRLHKCGVCAAEAVALPSPVEIWDRCTADRELVVFDASSGGDGSGIVRRWVWPRVSLPTRRYGTHDLPLEDVLSLGQTLGLCPAEVVVWTISGVRFAPGEEPSSIVRAAAESLATSLYEEFSHA